MPTPDDEPVVESTPDRPAAASGAWMRNLFFAVGGGFVLIILAAFAFDAGWVGVRRDSNKKLAVPHAASFQPPSSASIPQGPSGDAIRRGEAIFTNTGAEASMFVGNALSCSSCHLDGGRRANSAPLWAAWVAYPKYRSKNKQINTMEDRIKGCFTYSMNAPASPNGGPPPVGHEVYKDLQAYMHWLATGAPTGVDMVGAGYPALEKTALGYDPVRGERVFAANCSLCHGADGQGQRALNGRYVFPPLWGPNAFNWGAGMARVNTAAGFIKANMPFGQSNRLTDQQAWDVAAYIDSRERPRDPRQTGTVAEAARIFHSGEETFYGRLLNGHLLGQGVSPSSTTDTSSTTGRRANRAG
jgi:thiosulfate dehydrogenase